MTKYRRLRRLREYEKVETATMVTNSIGGIVLLLISYYFLIYSSTWGLLSFLGSVALFFAALQSYYSRIRIREERNRILREEASA